MSALHLPAVVAAAGAGMAISLLWYTIVPLADSSEGEGDQAPLPQAWKMIAEVGRNLLVALVIARLATQAGTTGWPAGAGLGLVAWVGFPVVLLSGSVIWESVPWTRAAAHAGDWLAKLVAIAVIVTVWR